MGQRQPNPCAAPNESPAEHSSGHGAVFIVGVGIALLILLILLWPRRSSDGGVRGSGLAGTGAAEEAGAAGAPAGTAPIPGLDQTPETAPGTAEEGPGPGAEEVAATQPAAEEPRPPPGAGEKPAREPPPEPGAGEDLSLVAPPPSEQPVRRSPQNPFSARAQRGRSGLAARQGMTAESESAVERGLRWLARKQSDSGKWEDPHAVGVTGLAVLAFLGAGYTHQNPSRYQDTVRRALAWLLSQQSRNGAFRRVTFYEQGIAAMAVSEACGMTRDPALRDPALAALRFILENMGPDGGYGYEGPGDDVHVTSFQVMALKSGHLAGFPVPAEAVRRLREYYARALGPDGTTGYTSALRGKGGRPGDTRTAVGLFCRVLLDCDLGGEDVRRIAEVVSSAGPQLRNVFQVYDGTYAMFQLGGEYWRHWNEAFRDGVIALQVRGGSEDGSWPGGRGGTICNTALYVMSLEVYYRYLPLNASAGPALGGAPAETRPRRLPR